MNMYITVILIQPVIFLIVGSFLYKLYTFMLSFFWMQTQISFYSSQGWELPTREISYAIGSDTRFCFYTIPVLLSLNYLAVNLYCFS